LIGARERGEGRGDACGDIMSFHFNSMCIAGLPHAGLPNFAAILINCSILLSLSYVFSFFFFVSNMLPLFLFSSHLLFLTSFSDHNYTWKKKENQAIARINP
jgi:hypothetical protein